MYSLIRSVELTPAPITTTLLLAKIFTPKEEWPPSTIRIITVRPVAFTLPTGETIKPHRMRNGIRALALMLNVICASAALAWPFHHRTVSAQRDGASVRDHSRDANTRLHRAVSRNDIEQARTLIAGGADVNAPGARGMTALMFAAKGDNPKVVKFLLQQHADTKLRDAHGWTALNWAKKTHHYENAMIITLAAAQKNWISESRRTLNTHFQESSPRRAVGTKIR